MIAREFGKSITDVKVRQKIIINDSLYTKILEYKEWCDEFDIAAIHKKIMYKHYRLRTEKHYLTELEEKLKIYYKKLEYERTR